MTSSCAKNFSFFAGTLDCYLGPRLTVLIVWRYLWESTIVIWHNTKCWIRNREVFVITIMPPPTHSAQVPLKTNVTPSSRPSLAAFPEHGRFDVVEPWNYGAPPTQPIDARATLAQQLLNLARQGWGYLGSVESANGGRNGKDRLSSR